MSMAADALPNLIVIGAMKCGTTSFHYYLSITPEIFMSAVEELDYFLLERNYGKGLEWYKSQFDSQFIIRGESSQNYTKAHHFQPGIVERMYECVPDAKLIYLVRDPVKRIESHYREALEGGYAPKEGLMAFLRSGLLERNHYVLTSNYYVQLSQFSQYFDKEQIFVVQAESLQNNRLSVMNTVFDFLGVKRLNDPETFQFQSNTALVKRANNFLGSLVYSQSFGRVRQLFPTGFKSLVRKNQVARQLITKPVKPSRIPAELANEISVCLAEDTARFRDLSGHELNGWCCCTT